MDLPTPGDSTPTVLAEDIEEGTKLWGQAADFHRTADFLAATGSEDLARSSHRTQKKKS